MMIPIEQVWLAVEPVDMRMGSDKLSRIVQETLGGTPGSGEAYAFCNRQRNRLKLIVWDGTGIWLCQRRLYEGHFVWPKSPDTVLTLSEAQWQWLIAGVDWQRLSASAKAEWRC